MSSKESSLKTFLKEVSWIVLYFPKPGYFSMKYWLEVYFQCYFLILCFSWQSLQLFGCLFCCPQHFISDQTLPSLICCWGLIFVQFVWLDFQYIFRTFFTFMFEPAPFWKSDDPKPTPLIHSICSQMFCWKSVLLLLIDRTSMLRTVCSYFDSCWRIMRFG